MAKTITINLSDSEFEVLQKSYCSSNNDLSESDITEDYIKGRLISILKAKVRNYDEKELRKTLSYTSFDPE